MKHSLEMTTFGRVILQYNEQALTELLSRKAQALVIYLAYQNHPISRSFLANFFWGGSSEKIGLSNLRTLLTRTRPYLASYLLINRDNISFQAAQPFKFDVAELKAILQQSSLHYTSEDVLTSAGVAQLEKALTIYQGSFLQNFYLREAPDFENWSNQERDYFHKQIVSTLQKLSSYWQSQENYNQAINFTSQLIQLEPWDEQAHRQIMLLLAKNGQRKSAIEHFRKFQNLLLRELDVAPEPLTLLLYERIRQGELTETDFLSAQTQKTGRLQPLTAKLAQLKQISLFAALPDGFLVQIADNLQEIEVKPGELVFEKGQLGDCLYIVASGQVRIHNDNYVIDDLGANGIFGEMAVLQQTQRVASVTALTTTRLWRLEQDIFYQLLSTRLEVAKEIIQILSSRLRERVTELTHLKVKAG